jgi:hypothetical protein
MKFEIVKREVFEKDNGPVNSSGRSSQALELLDRLRKVPIDSLLLIEVEKGTDPPKERVRIQNLASQIKTKFNPNFLIRAALSRDKRQIVVWKELKEAKA